MSQAVPEGAILNETPVVLVVEDEILVQAVVTEALSQGGYECATASSGEEALSMLRNNTNGYRALITDINLVGTVDGWDIARAAREIEPIFPVVYMSGKDADEWASKGVPNSIMLSKPFAPAQVVTAISQLLNASNSSTP
jgi:DNA-binding response OmpR family regulator